MTNVQKDAVASEHEARSLRRRDERYLTRVTALVHCHDRFQTVRIVDFSKGGLQLDGCFGVGPGQDLVVELLSGDRLRGKVAWSIGSRLGVKFLEALSAEHPALDVLRQGTRRLAVSRNTADPPNSNKIEKGEVDQ